MEEITSDVYKLEEMGVETKREKLQQMQIQWKKEQDELQQRLHDEEWERIREERRLVNERSHAGNAFSSANRSTQRFYDSCRADMEEQIYAAHGLSADRVEGMEEFRNGRFRGIAIAGMLATFAMIVTGAVLNGPHAATTVFGVAALGVEGSLLNAEREIPGWLKVLCRYLFLIPVVGFVSILIVVQQQQKVAHIMTIIFSSIGIVLIFFGTFLFLWSSPYGKYRRRVRAAKAELKEIQKLSDENDRKRQREKARIRKKALKMDRKEEKNRMKEEMAEAQRSAKEKAGALAKGAKNAAGSAMTAAGHVLPWRKKETAESAAQRELAAKQMAAEIYEELKAEKEAPEKKIPDIAAEEASSAPMPEEKPAAVKTEESEELEFDTSITL